MIICSMCINVCICVYIGVYLCTCVSRCMSVCMYISVHVCTLIQQLAYLYRFFPTQELQSAHFTPNSLLVVGLFWFYTFPSCVLVAAGSNPQADYKKASCFLTSSFGSSCGCSWVTCRLRRTLYNTKALLPFYVMKALLPFYVLKRNVLLAAKLFPSVFTGFGWKRAADSFLLPMQTLY